MAEYIDRDAAIESIMNEPSDEHYPYWYADKIKSIPAVNVSQVSMGRNVKRMSETNTVTIPLEEYMDLRHKADMNGFLMNELGKIEARFLDIDRRLWEVERVKNNG